MAQRFFEPFASPMLQAGSRGLSNLTPMASMLTDEWVAQPETSRALGEVGRAGGQSLANTLGIAPKEGQAPQGFLETLGSQLPALGKSAAPFMARAAPRVIGGLGSEAMGTMAAMGGVGSPWDAASRRQNMYASLPQDMRQMQQPQGGQSFAGMMQAPKLQSRFFPDIGTTESRSPMSMPDNRTGSYSEPLDPSKPMGGVTSSMSWQQQPNPAEGNMAAMQALVEKLVSGDTPQAPAQGAMPFNNVRFGRNQPRPMGPQQPAHDSFSSMMGGGGGGMGEAPGGPMMAGQGDPNRLRLRMDQQNQWPPHRRPTYMYGSGF